VHGRNELPPDEGIPFWKLVLKQFDDLLVKILIAAAVVDFLIALANGEYGPGAFVEPGVIILILIANGELWMSPGCPPCVLLVSHHGDQNRIQWVLVGMEYRTFWSLLGSHTKRPYACDVKVRSLGYCPPFI
jgi:Cation transporter/ATPase, N-terminus